MAKETRAKVAALRDIALDETMSRIGGLGAINAPRALCLVALRSCIIHFRTSAIRSDQVEIPTRPDRRLSRESEMLRMCVP